MLEQPALLLCPRHASATQAVVDAHSGAPLGFVRWAPARPWWLPFSGPVLAVHEHEDAPLLFTVHRCWSLLPWYEVRDADGNPVGLLLRGRVRDRFGSLIAVAEHEPGPYRASFRAPDGRSLGRLEGGPDGLRVTFAPEAESDPFTKMLLLAAALNRNG